MGIPTHEDAKVLLEIVRMRQDHQFQEAESWFMREFRPVSWSDFRARYPLGSPDAARVETVLRFWELVGALVDNGLMNEDLLFDAISSVEPIWTRIEPWLTEARAELGSNTWENMELLVLHQRHWRQMHRPKASRL